LSNLCSRVQSVCTDSTIPYFEDIGVVVVPSGEEYIAVSISAYDDDGDLIQVAIEGVYGSVYDYALSLVDYGGGYSLNTLEVWFLPEDWEVVEVALEACDEYNCVPYRVEFVSY